MCCTAFAKPAGGGSTAGWCGECALFAELEFHCVWQAPDGTLHDITPRQDGEPLILFMPDRVTRLRRTERGVLQPANRLSTGHYTVQGLPYPEPMTEIALSELARAWAAKLEVVAWDVCEPLT